MARVVHLDRFAAAILQAAAQPAIPLTDAELRHLQDSARYHAATCDCPDQDDRHPAHGAI